MRTIICLGLAAVSLAPQLNPRALAQAGLTLHVSPLGNDNNQGSASRPFATLPRALNELARIHDSAKPVDVTIVVHEGVYRIGAPLVIGPGHLPAGGHAVTFTAADGAGPVISGGRVLRGWRRTDEGKLSVTVAEAAGGRWPLRELFVNGQRRPRARHPNCGYLRVEEAFPDKRTGFTFAAGDLPKRVTAGAELVFLHDWSISRVLIQSIDHARRRLAVKDNIGPSAAHYRIDHFEKHPRYFIEDHPALLDAPGEWYLDKQSGVLTYWPLAGETPESIQAVVPVAPALLVVRGTPDRQVRNVHFRGLCFEHCAWPLPPGGYAAGQATSHQRRDRSGRQQARTMMPSAITLERAENCSITDCRIAHLGLSGVTFGSRTHGCRLQRSTLEDISGNGVNLGEDSSRMIGRRRWWQAAPEQAASQHLVQDNRIRYCGQQFFGAVAVWVGLARDMQITHNEIAYHPYTGVSVGWMWNPTPTPAQNNVVSYNHIHHCMLTLSDGGGIYTLGRQPGTRLDHNYIHDIPVNAGRAESNGMFLDEGSDQITIADNVIARVVRSPLRFHRAVEMTVRNNVLLIHDAKTPPLRYNRTDPNTVHQISNRVIEQRQFDSADVPFPLDAAGPRPVGSARRQRTSNPRAAESQR